ncbi:MAG: ribonuclease Z [Gemmatimonadales bacterium]
MEIVELKPGDRVRRKEYDIAVFETEHRTDTIGYALVEKDRLGRFDRDAALAAGVPEGPLWGQLHRGQTVTLADGGTVGPEGIVGPPRPGRTVVYSGDTRPCAGVRAAAQGADLLVHEATFGEDERARALETGHSTAREAAELARDAGVRRLVLTHISARYNRDAPELLAEAAAVFPAVSIARDGMAVDVPFPDRPS